MNSSEWVESARARLLINDINNHLLSIDEVNILHLVGRSGIGKTRSTLQACIENIELSNVLYFNSYSSFIDSVATYSFNPDKKFHFVIDDITMKEWEQLNNQFAFSNIRIITLGVVPEHKLSSREGIRIIEQPQEQDIIDLIKNIYPTIDELGCQNIIRLSDKDLRLLMLLLESYKREQALTSMVNVADRFGSMDSTLERILNQFSSEIGDAEEFKKYYGKLCLLIDVGIAGEYKEEITYLSNYFNLNQQEMDVFIDKAKKCWLGIIKNEFFEPLPRALSRYLFETESWPFVKRNLSAFINGMPTYQMKKRFINRIEECNEVFRKEAKAELSAWFLETFPKEELALLNNVENTKVFKVYTEFSPEMGLSWLKRTLQKANSKELLNFKGSGGIFSGNKERRYIVWLCEHLACFKEYFWACEEILYILAQHETEIHISNNSRGVWSGLFTPILSNTETPFESRYNLLMQRLKDSTISNIDLVLEAITPIFKDVGMKMVPPKVIGGRVVPMEWRPATQKDLYDLRVQAMKQLINVLRNIKDERQDKITAYLIEEIRILIDYGFLDDLIDFFEQTKLDEDTKIRLKNIIQELLHSFDNYGHPINRDKDLREWLNKLSDSSFDGVMKDYILGDYWGMFHRKGDAAIEEDINYLANEIITNKIDINCYLELKDDVQHIFLQRLMRKIGYLDFENQFESFVSNLIMENKNTQIAIAYLQGVVTKENALPSLYKSILGNYEEEFPKSILMIVINCEVDNDGYQRLLKIIKKDESLIPNLLSMQYSNWNKILSNTEIFELLKEIKVASSDTFSRYTILKLAYGWHRINEITYSTQEMSVLLIEVLLECLSVDTYKFDDWDWQEVFKFISEDLIEHKIALLVMVLKSKKTGHSSLENFSLENLKKYAKEGYSDYVMSNLGKVMLNNYNNFIFYLHVYRGLFESIELDIVKKWVETNGVEAARALARHIDSPASKEDNEAYVPPLTEWLLSTYEWDDRLYREFIAGRHSFEVINISETIKNHEHLEKAMEPYLSHNLSRVREWAEYEIKQSENLRKDNEIRKSREEREY
ncbi:hypothetical protein [Lysinibacillus sphaericus]|uniref:hypothetical protein n=1 Tax=Lysinibacillus sphaericus TaxID=1421 RepID=UPI003D087825